MHAFARTILALLLVGSACACSSPPSDAAGPSAAGGDRADATGWPSPERQAKWDTAIRERTQAMVVGGNARSAIVAALVRAASPAPADEVIRLPDWDMPGVREALDKARERAPDDPLLAWAELGLCPMPCDRAQILRRLQRLDPDNAAVWLETMKEDLDAHDLEAADRHLREAARASRYDWQFETFGGLIQENLRGLPIPPLTPAEIAAMDEPRPATLDDMTAVQAMAVASSNPPSLAHVRHLCLRDGRAVPERRSECIALAGKLANARDLISQLMGLVYLEQLTRDTPDHAQWAQRLREIRWVHYRAGRLIPASAAYWHQVWTVGEVAAMRGLLQARGIPLAPPPEWTPDQAKSAAPPT